MKELMTNREILRDVQEKVNRLHSVVIGDKEANQDGLVHKVKSLERAEKNRTKFYVFISALSGGLTILINKLINKL